MHLFQLIQGSRTKIFTSICRNNLNTLSNKDYQKIRGKEISIIFQEPMSSLNPSMKCGDQISEIIINHEKN